MEIVAAYYSNILNPQNWVFFINVILQLLHIKKLFFLTTTPKYNFKDLKEKKSNLDTTILYLKFYNNSYIFS